MLTENDWLDTRILVGKLLAKGMYEDARELLEMLPMMSEREVSARVRHQAIGMLFVLDVLHPKPREGASTGLEGNE